VLFKGAQALQLHTCAHAVGHADFYPATSGKVGAAKHLVERFGTDIQACTFMCDDDNVSACNLLWSVAGFVPYLEPWQQHRMCHWDP
jgi:hypothetical protein